MALSWSDVFPNSYAVAKDFDLVQAQAAAVDVMLRDEAKDRLEEEVKRIRKAQRRFMADSRFSVLLLFHGMDVSASEDAVKFAFNGVNPKRISVHELAPRGKDDLRRDFLWSMAKHLPARGDMSAMLGSYYREVVEARVNPDQLAAQRLPIVSRAIWEERYESIRHFEQHLARQGTIVLKFFLHLSPHEFAQRLRKQLDESESQIGALQKNNEIRDAWEDFQHAYDDAICATHREHAPWYVVPSDHKASARYIVARTLRRVLESLPLSLPEPNREQQLLLNKCREELDEELER